MLGKLKLRILHYIDNQYERNEWVVSQIVQLPDGARLLDAGCGSQKYRQYCQHLDYVAQDFGGVTVDQLEGYAAQTEVYRYGDLDIVSDIWKMPVEEASFDAILCTEVFEHIPYPNESMREFARVLKPGGTLILTAPYACLRHMDPYFFYTGFSNRWYEHFLRENHFELVELKPQGDYNKWMAVEVFRTIRTARGISFLLRALLLLPAFGFYYFASKKPTPKSIATLVGGYFVCAKKV